LIESTYKDFDRDVYNVIYNLNFLGTLHSAYSIDMMTNFIFYEGN